MKVIKRTAAQPLVRKAAYVLAGKATYVEYQVQFARCTGPCLTAGCGLELNPTCTGYITTATFVNLDKGHHTLLTLWIGTPNLPSPFNIDPTDLQAYSPPKNVFPVPLKSLTLLLSLYTVSKAL